MGAFVEFWTNTLSNFVAGAAVLLLASVATFGLKALRKARARPSTKGTAETSEQPDYVPPRNSLWSVLGFVFCAIGVTVVFSFFYAIVTTIPQWPSYETMTGPSAVLLLGFPASLFGWVLSTRVLIHLSDPASLKRRRKRRPTTRLDYAMAVIVLSLLTYGLLVFAAYDPFGWMNLLHEYDEARINRLLRERPGTGD